MLHRWSLFLSSRVCSNRHGLIRKYGLNMCRQCFRQYASDIGFKKVPISTNDCIIGNSIMCDILQWTNYFFRWTKPLRILQDMLLLQWQHSFNSIQYERVHTSVKILLHHLWSIQSFLEPKCSFVQFVCRDTTSFHWFLVIGSHRKGIIF